MIKPFILAVGVLFVSPPASDAISASVVPQASAVTSSPLPQASGPQRGVLPQGSQERSLGFKGRVLKLSFVRSGPAGLAMLKTPDHSVISSLPDVTEQEFVSLVEAESGCRGEGPVRSVASRRGTMALAVGIACD